MKRQRITHHVQPRRLRRTVGFTIIELLTAVAIIIVILSIVVVAVNSAIRGGQRANTQSLMTAINQGLNQFKEDTGYLPPVLNRNRDLNFAFSDGGELMSGPRPTEANIGAYAQQIQEWYSITTLADYLLGYGPAEVDSSGEPWSPDGYPGPGIRRPGDDGYWGASGNHPGLSNPGTFAARRQFLNPDGDFASMSRRYREGTILGPYVQLRDERLLGSIDPDNPWQDEASGIYRVIFPGEAGYDPDAPKVIVDYWGQPIRFFRLPYPQGQPGRAFRRVPGHPDFGESAWAPPSLSHVIALRPFSIAAGAGTDATAIFDEQFRDAEDDTTTIHLLETGEFALLSAGPNRSINVEARVDDEETNRDNLLEVGP